MSTLELAFHLFPLGACFHSLQLSGNVCCHQKKLNTVHEYANNEPQFHITTVLRGCGDRDALCLGISVILLNNMLHLDHPQWYPDSEMIYMLLRVRIAVPIYNLTTWGIYMNKVILIKVRNLKPITLFLNRLFNTIQL